MLSVILPILCPPAVICGVFCCSLLSLSYPVIVSAVTARSHPPPVCPLSPPQTVEHGFPHQPSALSYSPSLQLLAIGTRSGAIKLYPIPACVCVNGCQGGIRAACLNLRQAVLMNVCDAAKSSSAVHTGHLVQVFHFPTLLLNAARRSQTAESVSPQPFAQLCSLTVQRSQSVHSPH